VRYAPGKRKNLRRWGAEENQSKPCSRISARCNIPTERYWIYVEFWATVL